MKSVLIFSLFIGMLSFIGCAGHHGGGSFTDAPGAPAWYNVYGQHCGQTPGPGCDYFFDTNHVLHEDPNYQNIHDGGGVWIDGGGLIMDGSGKDGTGVNPPDGTDGTGTLPPPDGTDGTGTLPPPDGTDGTGTLPPPDGTDGTGTTPPPDGTDGSGTTPPPDGSDGTGIASAGGFSGSLGFAFPTGGVLSVGNGFYNNSQGIDYRGQGSTQSVNRGRSLDLIAHVSEEENRVVNKVGRDFANRYALSVTKGLMIAKTLNDYATLAKREKRSKTMQDVADYSLRLYGVPAAKATKAIEKARQGDISGLETLNKEVAAHWGTTPETSEKILKTWYRGYLNEIKFKK